MNNNKCLYCMKELNPSDNNYKYQWHDKCIKKFFNTSSLPELDVNDELVKQVIIDKEENGLSIPGVQKKLSLHLYNEKGKNARLTLTNYPFGYILKPQTKEYPMLPEKEFLAMSLAEAAHISCVPYALIRLKDNTLAYITKRIDRVEDKGTHKTNKIAMEDFCQLSNRITDDKYKGSYEQCAKIIDKYSSLTNFDKSELFYRLLFSFIIGNSDMHLKNFSLIQENDQYVLSKADDLLPIKIVIPEDNDDLALTMDGKNRNLTRNTFIKYGKSINLPEKTIIKSIKDLCDKKELFFQIIDDSFINEEDKISLKQYIEEKINILCK